MAIGIILHNIPEGIIIALPTYYGTKNKFKTFLLVSFSGMSEFCGALIGIEIIKGGELHHVDFFYDVCNSGVYDISYSK